MGLRPLDDSKWLEFDGRFEEEMALKTELLSTNYHAVVATNPEGDAASLELLEELKNYLRRYYPHRSSVTSGSQHAIVQASRLVQEDLCVLVKDDKWRLRAACVCFPSRWDLSKKIGTTLDEIHSPVPLYDRDLARPTNAFFDRLTEQKPYWRLNWTLLDSSALYQRTNERRATSGDPADWFFRVERQTLRRLPTTKAVVFTIRTYVTSLASMRESDAQFLPTLVHALESAPASVQDYKGWTGVAARLRGAL
jgi:hypothetical protein